MEGRRNICVDSLIDDRRRTAIGAAARYPLVWKRVTKSVTELAFVTRCDQEEKWNSNREKPLLIAFQRHSVACLMISLDRASFLDPVITCLQETQS